jgi:hypothetical protein
MLLHGAQVAGTASINMISSMGSLAILSKHNDEC